ncbi:MAG TPA: phosphotransferase [Symbiobacteriaceae bacterium]|nr:phosphotransferase [Symbiobacteriaceae bacterium]
MQLPNTFLEQTGQILATHRPEYGDNGGVTVLDTERGRFVVKAGALGAAEHRVLSAIAGEHPFVAAPLAATADMLLMTWLPGANLAAVRDTLSPVQLHPLVAQTAEAIRRVHGWRPDLPPTPGAHLDAIRAAGYEPDIVFAHGDYCLPNVMVDAGRVSAIIDWPHAGYWDRRVDLAAAAWSIRYNLKDEDYVVTFLNAYGYKGADLAFFERLWQGLP